MATNEITDTEFKVFDRTIGDLQYDAEQTALAIREDIRDGLRESGHGRLKLLLFDSLPVISGVASAGLARALDKPELVVGIPLASMFFGGGAVPQSKRGFVNFAMGWGLYALGNALPYADKIYEAVRDKI